jgi:tetratricopeptide (TPR) repeat protein/predicted Ser/Thr protein kinase
LIGARLGAYVIKSELGAGGMGKVYLADNGGRVALKILHPHLLASPQAVDRFEREAEIGRRVAHANVVRTLDVGTAEVEGATHHYLVMEYVEGRSLRALLNDLGTIPEALLREVAIQIVTGLEAIHAAGIVHRDLKPENVMLTDTQEIRIMDLGVAKLRETTVTLTREGHFAGSFLYASPEQFQGGGGESADLYGLGVVLYELAIGDNPFRRDDAGAVIQAQMGTVPRRLIERTSEISPFFSDLVAQLLEKSPDERFASAAELRETLELGEASPWWQARERERRWTASRLPRIPGLADAQLYGRDAELEALRRSWQLARDGAGRVVLVEGEAGIGKTRLVAEFVRSLAGEEAHVLYGSYAEPGIRAGLSGSVMQHFGTVRLDDALEQYLGAVPGLVPAFAAIVRHEMPPTGTAPLELDALHACNCHLMRALAAERPLLWIIDDIDLASSESSQIMLAMARVAEGQRIMLVFTAPPGSAEEFAAGLPETTGYRKVTLSRLGPREVIELLADAWHSELLAERLGGKIAHRSDGVPLFIVEMMRELKSGGLLRRNQDGTFVQTGPITDLEVPSAVKDLVEARLSELKPHERGLLDVGAVHGFEFDPDLVARVRESRRVHVLEGLAELERRTGIVRAAGRRYRFDQNQIHEVVLGAMAEPLREEYHGLLAEAYAAQRNVGPDADREDAVFLAWHLLHGPRPADGTGLLDRALDHLEFTARYDEAFDLASRALGVEGLVTGAARVDLLLRRGRRLQLRGDIDSGRATLVEAAAAADAVGDAALRSRAHFELGSFLYYVAQGDESLVEAQAALEFAREAGDAALEMRAARGVGAAHYGLGHDEAAQQFAEESLALARRLEDRGAEAACLQNMGTLAMRKHEYARAADLLPRAAAAAGTPESKALATYNLGILHSELGQRDDADRLFAEAVTVSRDCGCRRLEGLARQAQGHAPALDGDWPEAESVYTDALGILREVGNPTYLAWVEIVLGDARLEQGKNDEARAILEQAVGHARAAKSRDYELLARAHLARLDPGNAPQMREALQERAQSGGPDGMRSSWYHLWRATGEHQDLAEAHRLLESFLAEAPPEHREAMAREHRVNRDIKMAWDDS